MGVLAVEPFLDQLLSDQRRELWYYLFFGLGLVALGVIIIALGLFAPDALFKYIPNPTEGAKISLGWGGTFVTSLVGFPVKEVIDRIVHLNMFRNIKNQLANLKDLPKAERAKFQKRLEELMWKYIEQAALS